MPGDAWWLLFEWSHTEWQCATPGEISLSMAALHSFPNCGELAVSYPEWQCATPGESHSAWRHITHFQTAVITLWVTMCHALSDLTQHGDSSLISPLVSSLSIIRILALEAYCLYFAEGNRNWMLISLVLSNILARSSHDCKHYENMNIMIANNLILV